MPRRYSYAFVNVKRARKQRKLATIVRFVEYSRRARAHTHAYVYTCVYRSPRSKAKKTSDITEECPIENSSDEGWIAA